MRRFISLTILLLGAAALIASSLAPTGATAQTPQKIIVKVGDSSKVVLGGKPKSARSENPAIATVLILPDGRVQVTGIAVGHTRLIGTKGNKQPLMLPITVQAK